MMDSVTDAELMKAIRSVGKKSLSWDFLTAWISKAMAMTDPKELLELTKRALDEWIDRADNPDCWINTITEAE